MVELTIAMRLQKRSRLYDLNLAIGVALNDQGSEAIAVEVFDLLHSRLRDCLWPRLRHDDPINILPLRSSAFPKLPCSHVPNFVFETNHPGQYFSEILMGDCAAAPLQGWNVNEGCMQCDAETNLLLKKRPLCQH